MEQERLSVMNEEEQSNDEGGGYSGVFNPTLFGPYR